VILIAMINDNRPHAGDVPLPSGRMTSGIVRRGDRLLRPMGPWSPAVHEYLRHLEAAGFEGSPRVLGTEGNREVLTFIDGDVAMDPHWQPGHAHRLPPYARTDRALRGAAKLIRELHSAAAGFAPAITSYRFDPRPPQPPGPSCRSHHLGSSPKQASTHSLTCLPDSARSWTPTA
jgi:hypothetical protein